MNRLVSLTIFLLIAFIAWWSITDDYSEINRFKPAKGKRYAEIFMNDFEMITMGDDGKPSYILNGKHLERYNNSNDTRVQLPVFHLLRETGQWKVNADKAVINDRNETIRLTDNVVMEQQNIEPAVIIRAQNLLVHTKTQIVQTQAAVDITQGKSRLKSNGMIFNNVTGELELSSNVNGYFQPYD